MPRLGGSPLAALLLAAVARLCSAEARHSLRHTHIAAPWEQSSQPSSNFKRLLEEANEQRDTNELDCMLKEEAARVAQLSLQSRIDSAEQSLQAASSAEVNLKVQHGTLYAKGGSIEKRRNELRHLCDRLQHGRDSQKTLLKEAQDMAGEVRAIASKMQGHYLAKLAKVEGSQEDQKAWQEQGAKVCSNKLFEVENELSATRMAIKEVGDQLAELEKSRGSAESSRASLSDELAKSQTDHQAQKSKCAKDATDVMKRVHDLQSQRAASEGAGVTDCEVSAWRRSSCSKSCEGGTRTLTREVLRHASGGAACPRLSATVACNTQQCVVSCQLGAWSEWTQCTKMCNGGHRTRSRSVQTPPSSSAVAFLQQPSAVSSASAKLAMHDVGEAAACGLTQDVESCNMQLCGDDCAAGEWGTWGPCTKACGGGKRGRRRLKTPANHSIVGGSVCAGWQNEFSTCKSDKCPSILSCGARQDIVIMVDSSELLAKSEFDNEKSFVETLLLYFSLDRANGAITGLVFYGTEGDPEVLALSDSLVAIKERLQFAKIGRGGLNLGKGFDAAMTLFTGWSSRRDAPRTALVLLEGKPDSVTKSIEEAKKLKELGVRIVLAVVGECIVNKEELEKIASEPSAENLFYFKSYEELRRSVGYQAVKLCPSLAGGLAEGLPYQYLPLPVAR